VNERWSKALRDIVTGSPLRTLLAILVGFLVGAVFMIASNLAFLSSLGSFFSNPGEVFGSAARVVADGYGALFKGSIYNADASGSISEWRPLTETLRRAAPLIMAGLGLSLGFRVGLFNIGGNGQIASGMILATFVATRLEMPPVLHMIAAMIAAIVGAAALGALVGYLKARTGAHEVILTIMLNYVAISFFNFLLRDPNLLQGAETAGNLQSDPVPESAVLPLLLGDGYLLHFGFILAIGALFAYWWLMERSTLGFRLRMVGSNPDAAQAAGVNVKRTFVIAMALSAAFIGLASANQSLSSSRGLTAGSHSNIGFDAITVALLGGSSAPGVLLAGLLFGAFQAGGAAMQVVGLSPEVLRIIEGSIVLFIAAPPLIRAIFRLPSPDRKPKPKRKKGGSDEL
jgi:general nucleoside transport system permease protein